MSLDDARHLVEGYVEHYDNVRPNSVIYYITPKDMLAGRQQEIHAERVGSWRRRENSGRLVGSGPREERRGRRAPFAQVADTSKRQAVITRALSFRQHGRVYLKRPPTSATVPPASNRGIAASFTLRVNFRRYTPRTPFSIP